MFTNNKVISPQEAHRMMEEANDYVLLDVRSPEEYREARIKGAKLLPVEEIASRASLELPDKSVLIFVYCHSGMRAGRAVKALGKMGYNNIFSFGGIINWPYGVVSG